MHLAMVGGTNTEATVATTVILHARVKIRTSRILLNTFAILPVNQFTTHLLTLRRHRVVGPDAARTTGENLVTRYAGTTLVLAKVDTFMVATGVMGTTPRVNAREVTIRIVVWEHNTTVLRTRITQVRTSSIHTRSTPMAIVTQTSMAVGHIVRKTFRASQRRKRVMHSSARVTQPLHGKARIAAPVETGSTGMPISTSVILFKASVAH